MNYTFLVCVVFKYNNLAFIPGFAYRVKRK